MQIVNNQAREDAFVRRVEAIDNAGLEVGAATMSPIEGGIEIKFFVSDAMIAKEVLRANSQ